MTTSATILVVEDEPFVREAVHLLLEDAGYAVREAATAAAALAAVETEPPALVLLDLGLPDRSGLDLARDLTAHPGMGDVPLVAITGRAGADERQRCLDAGFRDYLRKPVEASVLLACVKELMP